MAENDFNAPKDLGTALYELHDVAALIEVAESHLESEGGSAAIRVLRVAYAKLQGALNYVDSYDIENAKA